MNNSPTCMLVASLADRHRLGHVCCPDGVTCCLQVTEDVDLWVGPEVDEDGEPVPGRFAWTVVRSLAPDQGAFGDAGEVAQDATRLVGEELPAADTIDTVGLYEQLTDWEGAPPAYLCRLPLDVVADRVMDFLSAATLTGDPLDGLPWVSVNLWVLQNLAAYDAEAYRATVGEWPWTARAAR